MKILCFVAGLMLVGNVIADDAGLRILDKVFINSAEYVLVLASSEEKHELNLGMSGVGFFKGNDCFSFGSSKFYHAPGAIVFNGEKAERSDKCNGLSGSRSDYSMEFLDGNAQGGYIYIVQGLNNNKLFRLD